MNATAGSGQAITISGATGRLPGWARALAEQVPAYTFVSCDVFRGKAVAAVRMTPGTGPFVVICSDETGMRQALGVP